METLDEFEEDGIFEEIVARELAEQSLYEFLKQAWPIVEPRAQFVGGWYVEALCEHLEHVYKGPIKDLIINVPPRSLKTISASCMFPSWVWVHEPEARFLCLSNDEALAMESSLKHRDIVTSEWYRQRWGHIFKLREDQNTKTKFENDRQGYRISQTIMSRTTGKGASIMIIDDPNNTLEGESDRESVNQRYNSVLSTRLNDLKTDKRILIQQRSNERDLTGHILETEDGWVKFIIPMEFETARKCKTIILPSTNGKVWQDPRKKEGELLCPERIGPPELARLKKSLGSIYNIAGQLQQRPAPSEGGIFKAKWFQWWKESTPPKVQLVIQSYDTAYKKESSSRKANKSVAYSTCTTWGVFEDKFNISHLILLNLWRDRVDFPDLRKLAQKMYEDYRNNGNVVIVPNGKYVPDMVLIESKATGDPLAQELRLAGIPCTMFDPSPYGDKVRRAQLITHIVEAGRIWLPARPPNYTNLMSFAQTFLDCVTTFPNDDESKDVVDSWTQAVHKVIKSGLVKHPTDYEPPPQTKRQITHYGHY